MITTHVLDTALGRPAAGLLVTLELREGADWRPIGTGATDGRLGTLTPGAIAAGVYRTGPRRERWAPTESPATSATMAASCRAASTAPPSARR